MTPLVPIMMFGWVPAVMVFFATLPPRRAVLVAFLGAWLFLPEHNGYYIPGLPVYTKMFATCVGVLFSTVIFDFSSVARFRPRWFDVPMVVWCLVPLPSAIFAGIEAKEGVLGVFTETVAWGLPYFIGRLYFSDLASLRELAIGVFVGGLVYVPFVLLEVRLSPQLHSWVYGFYQHDFTQTRRGDGFRPMVFMQHGLAVATFMGAATLAGLGLWMSKSLRTIKGVPVIWLVLALLVTSVLCKSVGALALTLIGAAACLSVRVLRTGWVVRGLIAIPVVYMLARTVGGWSGKELLDLVEQLAPDRMTSLRTRVSSETALWAGVQSDLFFGGSRFRWVGEAIEGGGRIIPDGLWIIALGKRGIIGLTAMTLAILLPAFLFVKSWRASLWMHPLVSPSIGWCVLLALYMADCLSNAMLNPIYMLAAGGLPLAAEQARAVIASASASVATRARPVLAGTPKA